MFEVDLVRLAFFLGMLVMSIIFYRGWKYHNYTDSKDWFYASLIGLSVNAVFIGRDHFSGIPFVYDVSISVIGSALIFGSTFYAWYINR